MESARTQTVRKRMEATREHILDHARAIITTGGVSALTVRSLAQSASVALPTLYNLIGKREEILAALFAQMQDRVKAQMRLRGDSHGLANVEALAIDSAAIYGEDEVYYKAAYLAMEHLDETTMRPAAIVEAYGWAQDMVRQGIAQCAQGGLLRGLAPLAMLEDLAIQSYRGAYRRWSCGQLTMAQARDITLAQSYIILMADATDDFRRTLDERIAALANQPGFDMALAESRAE